MRVEWKYFVKKAAPSSWLPGYPMSEDERRHRIWLDGLAARHDSAEAEARPATSSGTAMSAKPYRVDYGGGVLRSGTEEMQRALYSPTADFVANLGSRVRDGDWGGVIRTGWGALNEVGQGWGGYRGVKTKPSPLGLPAKTSPYMPLYSELKPPVGMVPKRSRANMGRWKDTVFSELVDISRAVDKNPEMLSQVLYDNSIIRNLDTLRQISPDTYQVAMSGLRLKQMPEGYTLRYPSYRGRKGGFYGYSGPMRVGGFAAKVGGMLIGSPIYKDFESRDPIFLSGSGKTFTPEDVQAIRKYLSERIANGEMGAGDPDRMRRIVDNLHVVQSPNEAEFYSRGLRPYIALRRRTDPQGRSYVNGLVARHEYGHAFDLEGSRGLNYLKYLLDSDVGVAIRKEVAANMAGGIGPWTPWLDTYRLHRAKDERDVNGLMNLYRRYAPSPNLPR